MVGFTVMTSLVIMSLAIMKSSLLQLSLGHIGREITDAAAIAPFVVIPVNNFCHFPLYDHRRQAINDRRSGITTKIAGNQGLIRIGENPSEFPIGRFF